MRQPLLNLIAALEEALAVREAQELRVEEAQQQADHTHQRFTNMMQAFQSGSEENVAAARQQRMAAMRNSLASSSMESVQDSVRLSARWEQALSDSCEALMRLYAFPEARPAAEKIMACISAIRLLQVADRDGELPVFDAPSLPPTSETNEEGSAERKRRMAGMALNFMSGMGGYVEKNRQTYHEKSEQTHHLLLESLSEATSLAHDE